MATLDRRHSVLVLIDFQERLMAAIDGAVDVIANARRLISAAEALDVPIVGTEQNPKGLGPTVPELVPAIGTAIAKMTFDACRTATVADALPGGDVVMAGCEAHVCVLQTALGLLDEGRRVCVVADAVGSRRPDSKEVGLRRLERHGAEIVTTEMVLFEWLGTAEHPKFKAVMNLIR